MATGNESIQQCTPSLLQSADDHQTAPMPKPHCSSPEGLPASWGLWKSRLPVIVVPVLASLRQFSPVEHSVGVQLPTSLTLVLIAGIVFGTGYLQLPFSVAWWLTLLAAFSLQTPLLLGVACVLSLSTLLGWYGCRLRYPHSVMALWGGDRRSAATPVSAGQRYAWQLWDFFVHLIPAILVIYWHGPRLSSGKVLPGIVTPLAAAAALPANLLWFWGVAIGRKSFSASNYTGHMGSASSLLWPFGNVVLADTNRVYRVSPQLPQEAWLWVYGSHWVICAAWLAALCLPVDGLAAISVFLILGFLRQPYTTGWWSIFLMAMCSRGAYPFLEGVVCCCGITTAVGFYGTQLLEPYCFPALLRAWILPFFDRFMPNWSPAMKRLIDNQCFIYAARFGDIFLHLLPTSYAAYKYLCRVTPAVALTSLPTNLLYLAASGAKELADTNEIYGVQPPLPSYIWRFIYGGHIIVCAVFVLLSSMVDFNDLLR